ncbi:hypothetical protein [Epilithonimonas xixisoli]|uniref:Uncharacterized protein n=1 Tax=Epilithonimonas xixisoli TaxID=1476462 RepID=A0A4R8I944_9FLAO|nr:hypothetical protein [Epilithonimonas xixisoli]TDX86010.1 hypothetical protein B0I22_0107 [Epilithonimonas xixisoli]
MDRKRFLIESWDRFLKPFLIAVLFIFVILNFDQISQIGKGLSLLILIFMILTIIGLIFQLIVSSVRNSLPERFVKSVDVLCQKLVWFYPVLLTICLVLEWNNKSSVEKVILTLLLILLIYDTYFKKKHLRNDKI